MSLLNPLYLVSFLPLGRRTLWKIVTCILPNSMKTVLLDVQGLKMYLDLTQNLDLEYAQGLYDKEDVEFLLSCYEENSYFLDIGANQGFYSLWFAKHKPNARILAFEPDPYSVEKFQKNISANQFRNIKICPYALSDSDVPRDLIINTTNNRGGNSMVLSQAPSQKTEVRMKVDCKTLLGALNAYEVNKVSALKIDIEGYEYPVLKRFFEDAPQTLYPKAIVVEAFGHMINRVAGSPIELLIKRGYRLVNHTSFNYHFMFR